MINLNKIYEETCNRFNSYLDKASDGVNRGELCESKRYLELAEAEFDCFRILLKTQIVKETTEGSENSRHSIDDFFKNIEKKTLELKNKFYITKTNLEKALGEKK